MTKKEIIKILDNSVFKHIEPNLLEATYEYESKGTNKEIASISIDGVLDCVTFLLIDWRSLTIKVSLTFLAKELFSLNIEETPDIIEIFFNGVYKIRFNK